MEQENQNLEKKKGKNWVLLVALFLFFVCIIADAWTFFTVPMGDEGLGQALFFFLFLLPLTFFLLIIVIFSWIKPRAVLFFGIVIILAIIVGVGALWYTKRPEKSYQPVEIQKTAKTSEEKCKDTQDLAEQTKCYINLAKETTDESYCEKIEIPEAPEVKANCYVELAILKNNPSICWKVETASLASSCWEYFRMKDWKTYKNEEYGFEIKYPEDWSVQEPVFIDPVNRQDFINKGIEPLTGAEFTSLGGPTLTVSLTIHNNYNNYTIEEWLKVYQETSPTGVSLGWKEEFSIAGEKGLKGGFGCCMTYRQSAFLTKGNKIYQIEGGLRDLQTGNYKNETIFNQILSTFRFIEEIKTGKIEINYEEIKRIQQSVDEGHQPWRLDPTMVAISEAWQYGFTEEDKKTMYTPHIDSRWVLGRDITELPVEITHDSKKYTITVIQPFPGEGKIWTISEIEMK